jgi:hypothetical protein
LVAAHRIDDPRAVGARPRRRFGPGGSWIAAAALATLVSTAWAAEIQFSATVDQTTVGLGDTFQLILTVQGEDMMSVPRPSLPPMADFNVLGSTSSQSTNISIINGQFKRQANVSFIYGLSAKHLGKAVIPSALLTYQGREYRTQPVEITVVSSSQGQGQSAPAPAAPPIRGQPSGDANLFLSVTPSRRTVYVGEPVLVDVQLCTRYQVTNGGWAALPSYDGFWTEKVYEADKFDFQRRTIEGKIYGVSELQKVVLFPLSPGTATIKPMTFNVTVAQSPHDIFDVFGSAQTVSVASRPVALEVLPLPENGKPVEFTGGVGQFGVTAALDRATTTNSEPINLTVRVTGSGNLRMVDKPAFGPIPGVKILDPEIKDDGHVAGDGVRGTKAFRYPIIPQTDGKFVIGPIAMAYFDPRAKSYKTVKTEPLEFSASGSVSNAAITEASGLRVLGTDIAYIKPDASRLPVIPMDVPWWPNAFYVLSAGMVGSAFWFRAHSERLASDRGYARMSRSSALVRRRLRQAQNMLKKNDSKAFHAALAQAVMGYVGDRFNIDSNAMTRDRLRSELERLNVPADTTSALIQVIDACEVARFSPDTNHSADPRVLFERARDVLGKI